MKCALCRFPLPAVDAIPWRGGGRVHFACAGEAELARTGSAKVSLVVGRSVRRPSHIAQEKQP